MFKIKSYSKAELAMLYFPDSDPHVAVNHLMRWIYKCKPLMDDLNKTGQQTGKISVGTTGQNGRGTSGGTVTRVLIFDF